MAIGDSYISGEAGRWRGNADGPPDTTSDQRGTDLAAFCGFGLPCEHNPDHVYGSSYTYRDGRKIKDTGCHRASTAEIMTTGVRAQEYINLACSGAETQHVLTKSFKGEAPQSAQLADMARYYRIKLVVVSISGNDMKFAEVISSCVQEYLAFWGSCADNEQDRVNQLLPRTRTRVGEVLRRIRDTLSDAGQNGRILLQSYPAPIPRGRDFNTPESSHAQMWPRLAVGCPFRDSDATWAVAGSGKRSGLLPAIRDMLRYSARSQGADFLDLSPAFAGHEVCAKGTDRANRHHDWNDYLKGARAEWARFVTKVPGGPQQGQQVESMHPNAYGHQAMATCVTRTYAVARGSTGPVALTCGNTKGKGPFDMTVSSGD